MRRGSRFALGLVGVLAAALLISVGLVACGHDETTKPDPPGYTLNFETPEEVLEALIESYQRRDIDQYAAILHPDFRFYFQDGDEPPELGRDYWTALEDSTGTEALFNSPSVSDISINLTYQDAEPAIELEMQGTMKIRVYPMSLIVNDTSGWTYFVEGDVQDMYFKQGTGANSANWYMIEWRDIPGGGGIGAPEDGVLADAVEQWSWGKLKQYYQGDS